LATGLVAPGAGRVVSSLARPVSSAVRGALDPVGEAARRVSGAVARDVKAGSAGLTEPEFLAAQSAGAPVNLMDARGETTRALARSAANTWGALRGHAKINERISRQVAQLLTSNDLSKVNTGIKILSRHPSLSDGVRHADAAIASVIARGSSPAVEWKH
jgi:hypothetical protein